jgi:uncharacterized protein with PQ loop repeat
MTVLGVFAVLGGISATVMWIPQFVALLRTGNTRGLSVPFWIVYIGTALGWLSHGIRLGQAFIIVSNTAASIAVATSIYYLMRDKKIRSWTWLLPGFAFAAVLIGLDYGAGSYAFGICVVIPVAISMIHQGVELMRDPVVTGVSIWTWVAQLANQTIWAIWSTMFWDTGTMISAYVSGVAVIFVLGWRLARLRGVGPVIGPYRHGGSAEGAADPAALK